jgi:hypothetical protein
LLAPLLLHWRFQIVIFGDAVPSHNILRSHHQRQLKMRKILLCVLALSTSCSDAFTNLPLNRALAVEVRNDVGFTISCSN